MSKSPVCRYASNASVSSLSPSSCKYTVDAPAVKPNTVGMVAVAVLEYSVA